MAIRTVAPLENVAQLPVDSLVALTRNPESFGEQINALVEERKKHDKAYKKARKAEQKERVAREETEAALATLDERKVAQAKSEDEFSARMEREKRAVQALRDAATEDRQKAKDELTSAKNRNNEAEAKKREYETLLKQLSTDRESLEKDKQKLAGEQEAFKERTRNLEEQLADLNNRLKGFTF